MAKEYKRGEKYYLPVTISSIAPGYQYPIELMFADCDERDTTDTVRIADEPELLLTAEDIAMVVNTENEDSLAELKSRNAELEALLKEVMATRDEAIKQNDELITENKKLKAENGAWQIAAQTCADNAKVADKATEELRKENKDLKAKAAENADTISRLSANKVALTEEVGRLRETIADRTIDVQHLTEENDKLKTELDQRNKDFDAMKKDRDNILADSKRTTEWYMEANRTASEAADANDELKAKIADLRNRVGEQLAQIQDLNAEVHFHKEFGEGLDKQQKELQARYEELDSVNKEQAEKIRKLDKALTDLKQRNDALQTDNANLNFLLEAQPEKGAARKVHVITNDGKEYMFRKCTKASFDNYNDFTVLKIYEGDTYVAGFLRGDSPENFAAWWTE